MKKCVIIMVNEPYLNKGLNTIKELINEGKYKDDIVLLIGDDLKNKKINFEYEKLIIKHFDNIDRSEILEILKKNPIGDGRVLNKVFQWHKINCFDIFFKEWDVCFYIDAGMHIFDDINCFFDLDWSNSLLAHSDSYPYFEWKLHDQFDNEKFPNLHKELNEQYNMNTDYFQSGILLYDTKIIDSDTKKNLIFLSEKYINSKTNEQGIMNLYFNATKNIWKPIPIKNDIKFLYDYWERNNNHHTNYIMLKYPKTI